MAKTMKRSGNHELAVVYVPITGYIEIVPMGEVVQTDWSIEEAMSFVLTGGTNSPVSISFTAGEGGERS